MMVVLGEGAWGSAIALHLAYNGHSVRLWCYDARNAEEIQTHRTNTRYMPGITFPSSITAHANIAEAVVGASYIFEAIPVQYMRDVLEVSKKEISPESIMIVLSKGIEDTLKLPSEIVNDVLGTQYPVVVMVGPSFAREVVKKVPTMVVAAATQSTIIDKVQKVMDSEYFKVTSSSDLLGIQACALAKNLFACVAGIIIGAQYKRDTYAALLTLSIKIMSDVCVDVGGVGKTAYGLAGLGDLLLTASEESKNFMLGQRIGAGEYYADILAQTGWTPEALNSIRVLHGSSDMRFAALMPIVQLLYKQIFEQASPDNIIQFMFEFGSQF